MSEALATLEKVRAACRDLMARGEKVTANGVLRITGGSKTTVLKHLDMVRTEIGASTTAEQEPAIEFLRSMSDPLVRRIWLEARALADVEYKKHIKTLLEVQAGLLEDIRELREHHTKLEDRSEGSEDHDSRLDRVLGIIERQFGNRPQRTSPDPTSVPDRDVPTAPATIQLLDFIARSEEPVTKQEVDFWTAGLSDYKGTPSQLRFNTLEQGLIGFVLTEKGRLRLEEQRRSATSAA